MCIITLVNLPHIFSIYTRTHTHTHVYIYMFCVCVCVCLKNVISYIYIYRFMCVITLVNAIYIMRECMSVCVLKNVTSYM